MENDFFNIILSVFVFILYIVAMALWKYMRNHNCIPNQEDIVQMKCSMNEMLERGLQHEETLNSLKSKLELDSNYDLERKNKYNMSRYKQTI